MSTKLINLGNISVRADDIISISKIELDTFYDSYPYAIIIKTKNDKYKIPCLTSNGRDAIYIELINKINED